LAGCDESLWGSRLGMFVWGVLLMGMHVSGGVVLGEAWCDFFVLFVAGLSLRLTVGFCFPGGILSRVVSLSVTGKWVGLGRFRLWMYVFCG